jgi:Fic family protein
MSDAELEIYRLDAAYTPFPTFERWNSQTTVDTAHWRRYTLSLQDRSKLLPTLLDRAREMVKRAAALDTGAIEGLYEVDRGFTFTVALQTTAWETALTQKGEQVRPLFDAQLRAYDFVLDLATKAEPISEAAIRALHEEVCRAQDTYRVMTAVGPQEQPLPKGQYKALPNHVRTRIGTDHSYAPVDVTPPEMARLVRELRTERFLAAHPVQQAAYAHYALAVIHPFADGNGRVARALASAFTYRAISMPIVVLSEHKTAYLDALASADEGDYQSFVDFMLARSLDTIELVEESVRSASAPSPESSLAEIEKLYVTKGGFTQDQVDRAGEQLLHLVTDELQKTMVRNTTARVAATSDLGSGSYPVADAAYRSPNSGPRTLEVRLTSAQPASANVYATFALWIPKDATGDDDIQIRRLDKGVAFAVRMDEIVPEISGVLRIRAGMFAESIFGELLAELKRRAEATLSE